MSYPLFLIHFLTHFNLPQATTLLANATFPTSGNFCFNVSIPDVSSLTTGTFATLYVQATGEGSNVSSCAGQSNP